MGAENFNFEHTFSKNGLLTPNFVFLKNHFWTKRKFLARLKFKKERQLSLAPTSSATTPLVGQTLMLYLHFIENFEEGERHATSNNHLIDFIQHALDQLDLISHFRPVISTTSNVHIFY